MKLRFYLRGLGIGILVTAMIFCLLPDKKEAMSDDEVRARALELGMVESSSLTLADVQNEQEKTEASEQEESVESSEPVEESTEPAESTETAESAETSEPAESTEPTEITEPSGDVVKITIERGTGSYTVSKVLEDNLLVEDAREFDNYLCNNGYSKTIRVGTYEIPSNASWEEIAKIITGKR